MPRSTRAARRGADEFPALPIALAVVVPFGIWIGLSRAVFFERLLPALAAWLFLVDFFLPAYRNSYNDVLVLNVFAAALVTGPRWPWMTWPCLAALPIGWYVYVVAPEDPAQINLPTLLFALGAAMSLFSSINAARPARWKRHAELYLARADRPGGADRRLPRQPAGTLAD